MNSERLNPLNDYLFLKYMGEKGDEEQFHTSFHLWEDSHWDCMLTEDLEIHFIDMVKFRRLFKKDIINNPLHRWLTFFDKNANSELLKEVINMDTAIRKAQHAIDFVQSSKEEFRAYQMREMAMCDYTSGMNYARREGMKEGMREGIISQHPVVFSVFSNNSFGKEGFIYEVMLMRGG